MSESDPLEFEMILKPLLQYNFTELSDSESSSPCSTSSNDGNNVSQKKSRILNYVERTVQCYSSEEFSSHFRLLRGTAYYLVEIFRKSRWYPLHQIGRDKISSEKAVLSTLWYLSNTETFRQISDRFDMSFSSAHRVLHRVIDFLLSRKKEYIQWPSDARKHIMSTKFEATCRMQNMFGAIDGSHIEILKPKKNPESYINRKGYPSLLLQAVVDHDKKFIDVFCGEPGSLHDARLLRKSALYEKMVQNPDFAGNYFLLGDSAYPNLHWIVPPFRDNGDLSEQQMLFNKRHASARVIVENALGLLKGRFRRLRHLDNLDLQLCSKLIMAACILHNICLERGDSINFDNTDHNQPENIDFSSSMNIGFIEKFNRQTEVFNLMFS